MITKAAGYLSSDGILHGSLEQAQKAELRLMFGSASEGDAPWTEEEIANHIIKHHDKIIDILTTTSRSKPKARKINGATRARKPKRHEAEQFPLPMEDTTKPAA